MRRLSTSVTKVKSILARTLTATAASVITAAALAPTAQAAPIDTSFLGALDRAGVDYGDPAITTSVGQSVCPMLVEPGKSFASVASEVGAVPGGVSPGMAAFFTGIAIQAYCPTFVSKLGDGSFLDLLGDQRFLR